MSTTTLIAETLIIGTEAIGWLAYLVVSLRGLQPLPNDISSVLRDWSALLAIAIIGIAYVVGVLVERVADYLARPIVKKLLKKKPHGKLEPSSEEYAKELLYVVYRSADIAAFLELRRSRVRLLRGTALNILIAGILLDVAHVWSPISISSVCHRIIVAIVGLLLVGLCSWVIYVTENDHAMYLAASRIVMTDQP